MTSKFFKSVLSASFCLVFSNVALFAQTPAPGATPAPEKKPKNGYFRVWNMLPESEGNLALIQNDGTPDGVTLISASSFNYYAGYVPVKPTRYALKLVRSSDPKTPLESFDVVMRPDVFVTFLAEMVEGKPHFEMIDDTYDPEKAVAGKLTIRHHFPKANVVVTSNTPQLNPRPLVPGVTQTIDGLPLQSVSLFMRATMADGTVQTWNTDVDFRKARHASLLIVPDPYGRFRPRVSVDGQAAGSKSVAASAQN